MSSVFSNRPYGCNPRRRATCSSQQKLGTKMDISKRTNKIRPSMLAECILHLTLDFPYIKLQIFLTQNFRFYCFPRQKRLWNRHDRGLAAHLRHWRQERSRARSQTVCQYKKIPRPAKRQQRQERCVLHGRRPYGGQWHLICAVAGMGRVLGTVKSYEIEPC